MKAISKFFIIQEYYLEVKIKNHIED